MSFLSMSFSCGNEFDNNENSLIQMIDETRETGHTGVMDLHQNGVEREVEFWPIEHPIEPLDEDRPVKCPMPNSSVLNDGRMHEQLSENMQKRAELSAIVNKEGTVVVATKPPIRAVRKRHHTLTRRDQTISPLLRMPPLYPLRSENVTIFHMLEHFN